MIDRTFNMSARLADRLRYLDVVATEPPDERVTVPATVLAQVRDALLSGETHYTSRPGLPPLRARIVEELSRLGAPAYDAADGVIVTAGARESLFVTLLGLPLGTGDVCTAGDAARYTALFRFMGLSPTAIDDGQPAPRRMRLVYRDRMASDAAHEAAVQVATESGVPDLLDVGAVVGAADAEPLASRWTDRTIVMGSFDALPGQAAFGGGFIAGPLELLAPIRTWKQAFSICTAAPSQRAAMVALGASSKGTR